MATCIVKEIHLDDIGTIFKVTLQECDLDTGVSSVVDVSSADSSAKRTIIFKKPDGTIVEKPAEFATDGTDGVIQYATVAGDLNQTGTWKIQARVELLTGMWSSDISKFKVYSNLE